MLDDIKKASVLTEANLNLSKLFPLKHLTPITVDDIEKVYSRNVLGVATDAKTKKGNSKGYLTGIMYLAPAKLSGLDVCPAKSQGCAAACLFSAGRGRFYSITRQRIVKTLALHFDRDRFFETVKKSIRSVIVKAKNKNMVPVIRLNGTSDIAFELTTDILQTFSDVQFYDYTKLHGRFSRPLPSNYSLTFSVSENNHDKALEVLKNGGNVAAVFATDALPQDLWGYQVVNGDLTDLRFLDAKNVVVGLKAKGQAKKDLSGFVIRPDAVKKAA